MAEAKAKTKSKSKPRAKSGSKARSKAGSEAGSERGSKQKSTLKVTLQKSKFGRKPGHAECVAGLGLRRRHQTVEVVDTPENRGMIEKVSYLLRVEEG